MAEKKPVYALCMAIAVLALFLLIPCAAALESVYVSYESLERGAGSFTVSGHAKGIVSIKGTLEEGAVPKEIFSRTLIADDDGDFNYVHDISMREPSGKWMLEISDSNSTETREVHIAQTRMSSYMVVSFLSPSPTSYYRTSEINLSVLLLDAGVPVENATVYTWGLDGEMQSLSGRKDGRYSLRMKVPHNQPEGKFRLLVTAFAHSADGGLIGGENSLNISIEKSPIELEFISPKTDEYAVGENLPIRVRASYADGSAAEDADVYAVINFNSIDLVSQGNGYYSATYYPKTTKDELLSIVVNAEDSSGNSGQEIRSLKPGNYMWWQFRNNAIFYIFPLFIIIYILYLSIKELRIFTGKSGLKRERQELLRLKKRLHTDFYKRNIIGERAFQKRNSEYNMKLDKIETKLSQLGDI